MRKSWGIITLSTQLPCPLVCGRAAAGDFHKCEVHLVFGPPPPVFRGGGLLADLAAAKFFEGVGRPILRQNIIFAACSCCHKHTHNSTHTQTHTDKTPFRALAVEVFMGHLLLADLRRTAPPPRAGR